MNMGFARNIKLNTIIIVFLSLLLAVIGVYKWFNKGTILYYWDTNYPLDIKNSFQTFFFSWNDSVFPGLSGGGWTWLPYWASVAGLQKLFNSLSLAQATLYILFIFLSIINFYFFSNYLFKSVLGPKEKGNIFRVISFLFGIFYAFNLYTFYYSYFLFNPQIYIYSLLPLNLLSLIKLYPLSRKAKSAKKHSLWVFIFFLSLFFMIPGFTTYIFFLQYLIWISFYLIFSWLVSKYRLLGRQILDLCLFFILVFLTHWWWLFPALLGFKDLYVRQSGLGTTIWFKIGYTSSRLLNALRLLGSPMMDNNPFSWHRFYDDKPLFTFPLFIFPFLIIFLITKMKRVRNKNIIVFLMIILLTSLFLVKFNNPPLAWVTKFAFEYIPLFGAFRDSYHKAGLYYVFSYFALSAVGFACLIKSLLKKRQKMLSWLSFLVLLIAGVVITGPFFLFSYDNIKKIDFSYDVKIYTLSAKTKIPPEYYQLKSFLESQCSKTTVLVLPKSSMISSAIWSKYNNSYVGQDILSNLINCNFLSNQLLQNDSDSFNFAPYLMLQQGDFIGFKNFLLQNQIGLVLVRKDNVPYYYTNSTSLINVDSNSISKLFYQDIDFKKIYENDFFTLYKLTKLENNQNYGFALAQSIVHTNSSLDKARDYEVLSKQIPAKSGSVVFNKNEDLKQYRSLINVYAPIGHCVGCVKISPPSNFEESANKFQTKIKNFIKSFIRNFRQVDEPSQDEKISHSILFGNDAFVDLMTALKNENYALAKKNITRYITSSENTEKLLKEYEGNFLDKNNKYMEARNFLVSQNGVLSSYLNSHSLSDLEDRVRLYFLLSLQDKELEFLEDNIWETDFENNVYRVRLDIAQDGLYECRGRSSNDELQITDISLDHLSPIAKTSSASASYLFSQGSYPVSIQYSVNKTFEMPSVTLQAGSLYQIALGKLSNGGYDIYFDFPKQENSTVALFVSKSQLDSDRKELIESFSVLQNDIIMDTIVNNKVSDDSKYRKSFAINSLDKPDYYLYFLSLDPQFSLKKEIYFKNILIEKKAEGGDVQFYCNLKMNKMIDSSIDSIQVRKINGMRYEVTLPQNYKGGFLTFNRTYDQDWQAYTQVSGRKHSFPHIRSAYANAWYIDNPDNRKVIVEFRRQSLIVKNAIMTLIGFTVFMFLYLRINEKK